jgi:hypothetical protein
MKIKQIRKYRATRTTSRLFVDGVEVGECVEDIGRPTGIKIPAETCIPEGVYTAKITYSPKFKRNMIQLYTNPATLACEHGGISFTGIRVHAGSTTAHTEGCPLFQGDLASLEKAVAGAGTVEWEITRE